MHTYTVVQPFSSADDHAHGQFSSPVDHFRDTQTYEGALLPIPIVVVGISTYLFFARIVLFDSYRGLILVCAALGAPFMVTTVLANVPDFNHNLVRASPNLGADPLTMLFRAPLHVIALDVISGAMFACVTSFDEVVVTLLILFTPTLITAVEWLLSRCKCPPIPPPF